MKSKYLFFIIFSLVIVSKSMAQDIDLFNKHLNDNFDMPEINKEMNFDEFQLLSRSLRMKDMMYAMVVPGYVHFYTHEKKIGYSILSTRLVGYAGLSYVLLKSEGEISLKSLMGLQINNTVFPADQRKKYTTISNISLGLIVGSYLFDWIHGQYLLQRKQEEIRYKYSLKLEVSSINIGSVLNRNQNIVPAFGVCFTF